MFVGSLVDGVVALGLEEEMSGLATDHGHQPCNQSRGRGVLEDRHIGGQEAHCAEQVQRLVDTAVVVVAMVIPALDFQSAQKTLHGVLLGCIGERRR